MKVQFKSKGINTNSFLQYRRMKLVIIGLLLFLTQGINVSAVDIITPETAPKLEQLGKPIFKVTYFPDYVGSDIIRRFFVELEVPASQQEIKVILDTKIRMVDRNTNVVRFVQGKAVKTDLQRYYFETKVNVSGMTKIRFQGTGGEIQVPIVIWGYNDLSVQRLVNGVPVPFRYPLYKDPLTYIKTRQTLTAATQPPVTPIINQAAREKLPTDDYLWDLLMDEGAVSRMHHVFSNIFEGNEGGKGIVAPEPLTVKELSAVAPFAYKYPASMQAPINDPIYWKYSIPAKNLEIPSNDVSKKDFHSGKFVDDGFNGLEVDGYRVHVLGMLSETRKYRMEELVLTYATQYQKTGDPIYAHKSLMLLSRMAVAYNYLSTMQHFRSYRHSWNNINMRQRLSDKQITKHTNTGVLDPIGIWESRKPIPSMATAYDIIFPTLRSDTEILPYLRSKGLPINSTEDLQSLIEHGIFLSFFQHAAIGQDVVNYPLTQNVVALVARVLDYPCTDLVDLLYSGDKSDYNQYMKNSFVDGVFYAGFLRDGLKFENAGGYNENSLRVLEALEHLNDYMNAHPSLFPEDKYPRCGTLKKLGLALKNNIQSATTPWTKIEIGDASSVREIKLFNKDESKKQFFGDEKSPDNFIKYFPDFKSPELAWSLVNSSGVTLPKDYPYTLNQLKEVASKLPANWREGVFALAGQGISLLRSGTGNNEMALYIPYKDVGHGHDIGLNLCIDGFGGKLVSHWGYAPYAHYGEPWYYSWAARNRGVIFDGKNSSEHTTLEGANDLLVSTPSMLVSDNYILPYTDKDNYNKSQQQRRINLVVKIDSEKSYFIDLYRMQGGFRHCRSYNPTLGACTVENVNLVSRKGTLAGSDVKYDDADWYFKYLGADKDASRNSVREAQALTLLYDVSEATAPKNTWQAVWKITPPDNLNADVNLKVNCLYSGDAKVALCTAKDPHDDHKFTRRQLIWDFQAPVGTPLSSQVLNLIEAFNSGKSMVKETKCLPVVGTDEEGFSPLGFMVELINGRKDYFILSANHSRKSMLLPTGQKLELDGRIAHASTDASGKITALELVEGTKLTLGKKILTLPVTEYVGEVKSIDLKNWTVDLIGFTTDVATLNGKIVYIEKAPNLRVPLKISNAQRVDGAIRVNVDADPLVQPEFTVAKPIKGGVLSGSLIIKSNRHMNGVAIKGKSGVYYKVKYPEGEGLQIDNDGLSDAKLSEEFPVGFITTIADYATGFNVTIPLSTSLEIGK